MDWKQKTTFTCLGASNHSEHDRAEHDYYATDPKAAELLLEVETDLDNIWECACGEGHLAKVFEKYNKLGKASDLINRGFGDEFCDFLKPNAYFWNGDIVTNPPYKYAKEFIEQAIKTVAWKRKICMFLKLTFLEGKSRKEFFKNYPPQIIYVCSGRIKCALNGDFEATGQSAACYAWFVWQKGWYGKPNIEWIN